MKSNLKEDYVSDFYERYLRFDLESFSTNQELTAAFNRFCEDIGEEIKLPLSQLKDLLVAKGNVAGTPIKLHRTRYARGIRGAAIRSKVISYGTDLQPYLEDEHVIDVTASDVFVTMRDEFPSQSEESGPSLDGSTGRDTPATTGDSDPSLGGQGDESVTRGDSSDMDDDIPSEVIKDYNQSLCSASDLDHQSYLKAAGEKARQFSSSLLKHKRGNILDVTQLSPYSGHYKTVLSKLCEYPTCYLEYNKVLSEYGGAVWTYHLLDLRRKGIKWAQKNHAFKAALPTEIHWDSDSDRQYHRMQAVSPSLVSLHGEFKRLYFIDLFPRAKVAVFTLDMKSAHY